MSTKLYSYSINFVACLNSIGSILIVIRNEQVDIHLELSPMIILRKLSICTSQWNILSGDMTNGLDLDTDLIDFLVLTAAPEDSLFVVNKQRDRG